jgi:hypothetical protein
VSELDLLQAGDGDVNLSALQVLIGSMAEIEGEIDDLEARVAIKKAELDNLKTRLIPDAMGHLTQIKVGEGMFKATVTVEDVIRANVKVENRAQAYSWLDEKGHGDLIKSEVKVGFSRAQLDDARQLEQELKDQGFSAELKQDIHWATLNAFVKEQLNKGMEFPEFIGIFQGKTTKVKYGK